MQGTREPTENHLPRDRAAAGARFRWTHAAMWLAASTLAGAAVGWLAAWAGEYRAPLVVFPLVVGALLGMTLAGLMRLVEVGHRPTLLAGALLAAAVAVTGQHVAAYRKAAVAAERDARTLRLAREAFGDRVAGRMPSPPQGVFDFLREEAARGRPLWGRFAAAGAAAWLSWAADALLLAAAALAVVIPACRQPYCDRCRSWYRTRRRGRLEPAAAAAVAAAAGMTASDRPLRARYRLVACAGGCGPVGFELSWQEAGGKRASATCRLEADRRLEVERELDAAAAY